MPDATILDPEAAPAVELAASYAERWEIESVFGEPKTCQRGKGVVLRSKSPDGVEQQIWAHLLVRCALRDLMADTAAEAGLDPDRTSFLRSLRIVRRQVIEPAAFPLRSSRGGPGRVIGGIVRRANPKRRLRVCPRVVKRKMSKFLVKRKAHRDAPQKLLPSAAQAVVITGASKTHGRGRSRADPPAEAA